MVQGTEPPRGRRPTTRPERRPAAKPKRRSAFRTVIEIVALVAAAFIVAMLVQAFLLKPFTIHQVSMQPTLSESDRILLNRLAYHFGDPSRGDVVVFDSPVDESEDLVKRVVAVAGDRIAVRSGVLYINEVAQDEPYLNESPFSGDFTEVLVHEDEVFVMGDNRNHSGDSRLFGSIDVDSIVGKVFAIYWPVGHLGGL